MNWFEKLTGFIEKSPNQVRENIKLQGHVLTSLKNDKQLTFGSLETPTLAELCERVHSSKYKSGKLSVREVVGDVQDLHDDESNAGSLFQVASQFNLLEMTSPEVTPESGIGRYQNDHTQGPACAIAAGAGTIYRNYFVEVNGQIGQSETNQIDCLTEMGRKLGNDDNHLWEMKNGYVIASYCGLLEISNRLRKSDETELDQLRKCLRIGLQWDTQVTLSDLKHTVSQAYCSALPVAYSPHSSQLWSEFAQLILQASYEATICSAILNSVRTGNNKLYLTLLGGGAFGNESDWIIQAIQRSLSLYKHVDLDVAIVSFGSSNKDVCRLVNEFA